MFARYRALDNESSVFEYEWMIGTTPGGDDLLRLETCGKTEFNAVHRRPFDAEPVPGTTYYVTAFATNNAGLVSSPYSSNGVVIGRAETVINGSTSYEMAFDTQPFVNSTEDVARNVSNTLGSIVFPEGAVTSEVKVHAGSQAFIETPEGVVDVESTAPDSNFKWGNYTFSIVAEGTDGGLIPGFHFAKPIVVVLHYDVSVLLSQSQAGSVPSDDPENAFMPRLQLYDIPSSQWLDAVDSCPPADRMEHFDYGTRTYTVHVCHLTQFALFLQQRPVLVLEVNTPPISVVVPAATSEAWMLTAAPGLAAKVGSEVVHVVTTTTPATEVIVLDATASHDPDGAINNVTWVVEDFRAGCSAPVLTGADVGDGLMVQVTGLGFCSYGVTLRVTDNDGGVTERLVLLRMNQHPTAVATVAPSLLEPPIDAAPTDGTASFDPEGASLEFTWTMVDSPDRRSDLALTQTPPEFTDEFAGATLFGPLDVTGSYTATLVVSDGEGGVHTTNVTFSYNTAPTAIITHNTTTTVLDGSDSVDDGGSVVAHLWTVIEARGANGSTLALYEGDAGRDVSFSDPTGVNTLFLPTEPGTYLVSLTVTDDLGTTNVATVFISIGVEPQDCVPSEWAPWGECSFPCGGGFRYRHRNVTTPAGWGGSECDLVEAEECNTHVCAEDCRMTEWSEWSPCDPECHPTAGTAAGTSSRTRGILSEPSIGGAACGSLVERRQCDIPICGADDCVVASWSAWGACSAPCGLLQDGSAVGSRSRSRAVLSPPTNGGRECPVLEQHGPCNAWACPMDCIGCGEKSSG